jgi:hypothetical protein
MKHKLLATGSMIALFGLALTLASSPIVVEAQPLALNGIGSKSGTATSLKPSVTITPTMTISQTLSDEAQRNTIAFDGLAFLTGSLGADSFFPPGKVADFWGFQYLRNNDPSEMGHNPLFLTSAAF